MSDLKKQLIRLGEQRPDLRRHLRAILDKVSWSVYDEIYQQFRYDFGRAAGGTSRITKTKLSVRDDFTVQDFKEALLNLNDFEFEDLGVWEEWHQAFVLIDLDSLWRVRVLFDDEKKEVSLLEIEELDDWTYFG